MAEQNHYTTSSFSSQTLCLFLQTGPTESFTLRTGFWPLRFPDRFRARFLPRWFWPERKSRACPWRSILTVSMRITKSPCTASPLARKVVAQFLPTTILRRKFQLANQHNILVVRVLLLTIRRIYRSEWLYEDKVSQDNFLQTLA